MRPSSRDEFAIAIICALTLEAEAVEELFDETYDRLGEYYRKQPGDDNAYVTGRIGNHNVVLCYMPGMGKGSAASVASSLKISYQRIEMALVVGICGAAPYPLLGGEIFLGDVIISDSVVQYDFGRQYPGDFEKKTGVKDTLGRPNQAIRSMLAGLQARRSRRDLQQKLLRHIQGLQVSQPKWCPPTAVDDVLFEASYRHKHYGLASARCLCLAGTPEDICQAAVDSSCSLIGCDLDWVCRRRPSTECNSPSIHIGTVASADTVMKSGEHRDCLVHSAGIIGFEMEGAGVWDNISCIIIKGVCDYADSHKNKAWQGYAAATGAATAKAFLEYWGPTARPDVKKSGKRHWLVPFRKNPGFVGREGEIAKVEELFGKANGPFKVALCGLGGVGKTQIALELAYRVRERDSTCSVFWIPCTSNASVEQALMGIAQIIGLQDVKPSDLTERVKDYLSQASGQKWLLIFDNADDMDMWVGEGAGATEIANILAPSEQGHILFTTRNRKLAVRLTSPFVIDVSEPDTETGVKILEEGLQKKELLLNRDETIALLEQLTFLPLAISQAAAYINSNNIELSDYTALLKEQESDVVELLSEDFGDNRRYQTVQNPVATTWLISFQQIQRLNPLAADYLSFMACISPRDIPQSLLPEAPSRKKKIDAVGLLKAFSFVAEQAQDHALSLHRLVHLSTRNWLRREQQFSLQIQKTANHLKQVFPDNEHKNQKLWREYLPHALSLAGESDFQREREEYTRLLQNVGRCLRTDGRYSEAAVLFEDITKVWRGRLGDDDAVSLMADLAFTYWGQGRWKEAKELGVQVLEINKRVLGPEHPNTLTSMANLASIYLDQGQWEEAKELGVQVLEIRKRVLGPEHPKTLTSMNNLAHTLYSQEKVYEAVVLMEKCVRLQVRSLGPSHPHTKNSASSLKSWKERAESSSNQPSVQAENGRLIGNTSQHSCSKVLVVDEANRNGEPLNSFQDPIRLVMPLRAFIEAHPLILASRAGLSGTREHDFHKVD
ncbi:hypothetical protein BJX64DRAFT_41730 [Aspergillus heterothallicus]